MNLKESLFRAFTILESSVPHWSIFFLDPLFLRIKTWAVLLKRLRIETRILTGSGPHGPVSIAYLGSFRHSGFFSGLIFKTAPAIEDKGHIMLIRLPQAITDLRKDHDFIFVELPYFFLLRLSGMNGFTTTPWLHQILDLSIKGHLLKAMKNKGVKRHIKKIEKYNISVKISTNMKDLNVFYNDLYKPFIRMRHNRASIAQFDRLRFYLKKGWLFQVMRNKEPIYAALCCNYNRRNLYRSLIIGQKTDIDEPLKKEIGTIAYYMQIIHAMEQGYSQLDFGLSRPLLNDGVFRFKKKWGSSVSCGTLNQGLWVGVGKNGHAATDFLSHNPFAWLDNKGQWHGLIVVSGKGRCSQESLLNIKRENAVPGLRSLFVISPAGFDDDVEQTITGGPIPAIGKAVQLIL